MPKAATVLCPIGHSIGEELVSVFVLPDESDIAEEAIKKAVKSKAAKELLLASLIYVSAVGGRMAWVLLLPAVAVSEVVIPVGVVGYKAYDFLSEGMECYFNVQEGFISEGAKNVLVNGRPASKRDDGAFCVKHTKTNLVESLSHVIINGKTASRVNDRTVCGAYVIDGSSNVFFDDITGAARVYTDRGMVPPAELPAPDAGAVPLPPAKAQDAIQPAPYRIGDEVPTSPTSPSSPGDATQTPAATPTAQVTPVPTVEPTPPKIEPTAPATPAPTKLNGPDK